MLVTSVADQQPASADFAGPAAEPTSLRVGQVELNLDAHLVVLAGRAVPLPPKELGILATLMSRAGRIVSEAELIERVWGPAGAPATSIAVYVRRLRRRLETDPHHPRYIRTVRGYGYVFDR